MSTATPAPAKSIDQIAHFLQTGSILKNFTFPRLFLPNIAGYKPSHYAEIGALIAQGKIPVVLKEGAIAGAAAFYELEANRLCLTKVTEPLNTPEHWSTIVHEATHAIQDKKKWKMTLAEMEADAHFAQALFLHYKGGHLSSGYMQSFGLAAKDFAKGDMREFKKRATAMIADVGVKYKDEKGYEKLFNKRKNDGI
jgi:hypothetical protein